jgi:hypothetical protein
MNIRTTRGNSELYFWFCLVLVVTLSIAGVLTSLNRSLTIDEPFSANMANLPWAEMLAIFRQDPALPVYYAILKFWVSLFGDSEPAIRSFSTICFALTIVITGITAKRIGGMFAGVAATMLASISSVGMIFAGTARPYALLSLLTAISTLIFFTVLDVTQWKSISGRRKIILFGGLIAVNLLALLTHPIFIFFMIGCSFAAWIKNRQSFRVISFCNMVSVAIFLTAWGSFLFQTTSLSAISWMEVPDIKDLIHGYLNLWGINETIALFLFILFASIGNFQSIRNFIMSQTGLIGLSIVLASSLLPFLISQYRPVFDDSRTPALFFPLACVVVARLVTRFENRRLTFAFLAILVGFVNAAPILVENPPKVENSPRTSMQYVLENAACGDVFIAGGISINEISYYMRHIHTPNCIKLQAFPISMRDHPGWMDASGLLENPDELLAESRLLMELVIDGLESDNHLWFFYESESDSTSKPVLDILKNLLDQEMVLAQTMRGYGTFFDSVLVYTLKK